MGLAVTNASDAVQDITYIKIIYISHLQVHQSIPAWISVPMDSMRTTQIRFASLAMSPVQSAMEIRIAIVLHVKILIYNNLF